MTTKNTVLIAFKTGIALLGLSAIITEIATLIERGVFDIVNFFSFFTIQVNSLVVIVMLLSAFAIALKKTRSLDVLRAATTVYIVVVGVGFAFLLAGLENVALTAVPLDNIILHYLIPALVVLDFIFDRPQTKIRFQNALIWLVYPAAYLGYSLLRGAMVGWYPYPFLNPGNGVETVVFTSLGLFGLGAIMILNVTLLSGHGRKRA